MPYEVGEIKVTQKELFDMYEEVLAQEQIMKMSADAKRNELLAPIAQELLAIDQELDSNLEEITPMKQAYEKAIRNMVIEKGETLKGSIMRCEFVKGGFKLRDMTGFLGFAKEHPDVLRFFDSSDPSTRLVGMRGK